MADDIDEKMVEHVAKALFAARPWSADGPTWDEAAHYVHEDYFVMARAAIDAIWNMPIAHGPMTIFDLYRAMKVKP